MKLAVIAGLAIGVVITLSSGELRAGRDVEGELLRANEALEDRLARQELRLAEALAELEGLRDELDGTVAAEAGKPPSKNPGTSSPGGAPPKSAAQVAAEERAAFRAKVLVALEPELTAIEAREAAIEATAAAAKETFDDHQHQVEFIGHGWVKVDVMLDSEHHDVVREPYRDKFLSIRDPATNGTYMKTTTKPK